MLNYTIKLNTILLYQIFKKFILSRYVTSVVHDLTGTLQDSEKFVEIEPIGLRNEDNISVHQADILF
jgi:hypothetical protein